MQFVSSIVSISISLSLVKEVDFRVKSSLVKIALPYFELGTSTASVIPWICGLFLVRSLCVSCTHNMSQLVFLHRRARSSSLSFVIPSILTEMVVKNGTEKCLFIGLGCIVSMLGGERIRRQELTLDVAQGTPDCYLFACIIAIYVEAPFRYPMLMVIELLLFSGLVILETTVVKITCRKKAFW